MSHIRKGAWAACTLVAGAGGFANASTVGSATVVESSTFPTFLNGSNSSGSGTGVLDSNGTLVVTLNESGRLPARPVGLASFSWTATDVFTGTLVDGTFTPASATEKISNCGGSIGQASCTYFESAHINAVKLSGVITSGGGTLSILWNGVNGNSNFAQQTTYTVSAISPVPLPAPVWLLGSGLAGLLGAARRSGDRKQAAPAAK